MRRNFKFGVGEYYHIYSRGVDKRVIFVDDADHHHFMALLFLCNSNKRFVFRDVISDISNFDRGEELLSIGAFCLMPNHVHFLVKETNESGISLFCQKIFTAYSMYFNKKYSRTGSLFEGAFKAKHADTDEYLKYLFSYIHLNPLKLLDPSWKENGLNKAKNDAVDFLGKYQFSSYNDYAGGDVMFKNIIKKSDFPEYFISEGEFLDNLRDWFDYST